MLFKSHNKFKFDQAINFCLIQTILNCFYFRNETSFYITPVFRQTGFKEMKQIQEYTLDDLVGTCGGYVGMFLGYAFIQLPHLFQLMLTRIKQEVLT